VVRRTYNKLVRDRIPEIIVGDGKSPVTRTLDDAEYVAHLKMKLVEEAQEAAAARSGEDLAMELADVLEVVRALATASGLSLQDVEEFRRRRAVSRGGFERRILLVETRE
jgi:predicted house-cleaning noncanonical NTP pyrophosphatase (MazG superfamily)